MLDISSFTMGADAAEAVLKVEDTVNTFRNESQEAKFHEVEFIVELRGVIFKDFVKDGSASSFTNDHKLHRDILRTWEHGGL